MKIFTIVGARPQFIKASVVSKEISKFQSLSEIILHTGQHFDENMSDIFFNQLEIPKPDYQLDIHSSTHGQMTGRMLAEIEKFLIANKPDRVLVYGDTNSTLAGALAAAKLHIPVAHVEAGLRSYNMKMPEEINRILTDQVSDMLFCPTDTAVENLKSEGFEKKDGINIFQVGDVMQDAALLFSKKSIKPSSLIIEENEEFVLSTLHRAENTDDPKRLNEIITAINHVNEHVMRVVMPLHPRTRKIIANLGINVSFDVIDPVGYLEMLWLINCSKAVVTDSGGLQKEAYFFQKPCVTTRDQTEWTELVDNGVNVLVGADKHKLIDTLKFFLDSSGDFSEDLYGGGKASHRIVSRLMN